MMSESSKSQNTNISSRDYELELRNLVEAQDFASRISKRFIRATAYDIDQAFTETLSEIGEHEDVDHASIMEIDEQGITGQIVYEWSRPGFPPIQGNIRNSNVHEHEGVAELYRSIPYYCLDTLNDIPEVMKWSRADLETQGVESLLMIPFKSDGRIIGVFTVCLVGRSRNWGKVTIRRISMWSDIIGNALTRKSASKSFLASTEMLRTILDTIPVRVFWKDTESRYLGCNRLFAQDAGLANPNQIVGLSDKDMPWKDDAEKYRLADLDVIHTQQTIAGKENDQLVAAQGKKWIRRTKAPIFDQNGEAIGVLGTYEDVTETKQNEEIIARLAACIEQASEDIIITDLEGVIQYVNPAFTEITGYSKDEAIGHKPNILKSDHHDDLFYESLWATINGNASWSGRFVNKRKNGQIIHEHGTISPIFAPSGEKIGYVALKRDMTDEVKLERQLRQAQKMEAIGTLAGGIAHDFNNILSAILGYAGLALDDVGDAAAVQSCIEEVVKAGSRAKDLVAQILTFSRQTEIEPKPTRLQPVIREAVKLLRGSIPSTIEIRTKLDQECGSVVADPVQVHQVIMNLCTNAYHAMRDMLTVGEQPGRECLLTIELSHIDITEEESRFLIDTASGAYACLTVSDTGHGMDASVLEHIFEPYFTTKEVGEGTGLGLATVQGIIRNHKGFVKVYSEVGHGSVFRIFLPLCEEPSLVNETPDDRPQVPRGTERILFVDDEEQVCHYSQRVLSRLGYQVTIMPNAIEALRLFTAAPDNFDLIVTDFAMPKMTGVEFARNILTIRAGFPIILCTGFTETQNLEKALEIGVRRYMIKPVLPQELAKAVRKALDETYRKSG
jgi:PAS domain S-box-containing protein